MKFYSNKQDKELLEDINSDAVVFDAERKEKPHAPHALTADEVLGVNFPKTEITDSTGALEALKKRIAMAANKEFEAAEPISETKEKAAQQIEIDIPETKASAMPSTPVSEPAPQKSSLMDKCQPYFLDDDGKKIGLDREPLYKLQSVADIIKSDSEETIKRLSQKYGISFDTPVISTPTPKTAEKNMATQFQTKPQPEIVKEDPPAKPQPEATPAPIVISDIDMPSVATEPIKADNSDNNATVTFTPISGGDASAPHISVTTKTQHIDLTGELISLANSTEETEKSEVELEKNDFDDFVPEEEFNDIAQAKKIIRRLSIKKRNTFLATFFSFFLTSLLAIAKLPFIIDLLLSHTFVGMIICSSLLGIIIILNIPMFKSLPKFFSRRCEPDSLSATSALTTVLYAVFGIISDELFLDILLLEAIILSFRSLSSFWKISFNLSNFKLISRNETKQAVKLISDHAVTFAMAKDAIEGDVLVASSQKADHLSGYFKYTTYGSFLGGRLRILAILSLLLSCVTGLACASYFDGAVHGLFAAAAIECFAALPTLFFIDTLPLYNSAKKLNRTGAMIAGKTGAEHLEMANAVVLGSCDLFPTGTVTLHQMKILAENNLDDTLIRAASLTEYIGSTLAPIFKGIAKTGNISVLPDADTVKYEDRMGISGWVDNRLLFIGNRTLMEAHGIDVPSVEVDRKILRQGYFPVYVATRDKACALLIVQYNVNPKTARELRKLTKLGVTLLIDNSDPNLTEEMICDYLGLYSDSVKVMSAAGCHMHKSTVTPVKSALSPAVYKGSRLALATILNCASRIKRSNTLLCVIYVIAAILGAVIFAYASLGGSGSMISGATLLIYGLICTVASYLIYLTQRP